MVQQLLHQVGRSLAFRANLPLSLEQKLLIHWSFNTLTVPPTCREPLSSGGWWYERWHISASVHRLKRLIFQTTTVNVTAVLLFHMVWMIMPYHLNAFVQTAVYCRKSAFKAKLGFSFGLYSYLGIVWVHIVMTYLHQVFPWTINPKYVCQYIQQVLEIKGLLSCYFSEELKSRSGW